MAMKILGIETSCDETAAAVVENGSRILSNVLISQLDMHRQFGGVVPEVAARSHVEVMLPIVQKAHDEAKVTWEDIDGIAVTKGPGLMGSLLIGALTARTLAELTGKPLYAINHIEAHTYANFLLEEQPRFPLLSLTVSGGHTQLVLFWDHGDYQILGRTRDDAAGEAFDKTARLIGLAPNGRALAEAAAHGDDQAFPLPHPNLGKDSLEFSFSGLKTAVLRQTQHLVGRDFRTPSHEVAQLLSDQQRYDLAASFQRTVVEILVERLERAVDRYQPTSIVIGGGVAANQYLRQTVSQWLGDRVQYPPMNLCVDNAAMIAALGYYYAQQQSTTPPSKLAVDPVLSM
jgi:N6-L-threonylcarbamoyladenine synthase